MNKLECLVLDVLQLLVGHIGLSDERSHDLRIKLGAFLDGIIQLRNMLPVTGLPAWINSGCGHAGGHGKDFVEVDDLSRKHHQTKIVSADAFGLCIKSPELPTKPKERACGDGQNRGESPDQAPLAASVKRRLIRVVRSFYRRHLHATSRRGSLYGVSGVDRKGMCEGLMSGPDPLVWFGVEGWNLRMQNGQIE